MYFQQSKSGECRFLDGEREGLEVWAGWEAGVGQGDKARGEGRQGDMARGDKARGDKEKGDYNSFGFFYH